MSNRVRLAAPLRPAICAAVASLFFTVPVVAQSPGDTPPESSSSSPPPSPSWFQSLSVNGLVSASYGANLNSPASRTNQYRVFDFDDRTLKLDVLEIVVQRAVEKPSDMGFRVDLTFGSSVPRVAAASGLFRDSSGTAGDFDLQQAFFSYVAPVGRGLRVDAGKFVTSAGYEVIEGYDGFNDNQTRSLLFGYAQPLTHTGVRVSYPFSDTVSAQFLLVNGWDNARDNNAGKTVGAQLALTPSRRLSVTVNYLGGPEQNDNDSNMRHLVDLVVVATPSSTLTLGANADYGHEAGVSLASTAGGGVRDASWRGVAGYARCALSPRTALTLRVERFDDEQGARTGYVQRMNEITVTPEFRPRRGLILRGDVRRDHSDRGVFEHSDSTLGRNQLTVGVNALVVF